MSGETTDLLRSIPGGAELLDWGAKASGNIFGDGEVVSLMLSKEHASSLVIDIFRLNRPEKWERLRVTFILTAWIDASLRGFSGQNVIGEMTLRRAGERKIDTWELGVGVEPGEFEIEIEPCFGAWGTLRANIARIETEALPLPPHYRAA
jgi:hypothetical protein